MTDTVSQHFVTFYSPGTIVAETDTKPVDAWNTDKAVEMARSIHQRHGAVPYGFRFSTRTRGPEDLDSRETAKSPFYYLGGRVETLAEVEARDDPNERILRSNMRGNRWDKIIINENSYRWTMPLDETDVVLDVDLRPKADA